MKYMKEIKIMEIKILKNEKEKICFKINDEDEREFVYDNFDYLIDLTYNNDEVVNILCDEDYDDYKKLLEGIISESRKDDYRTAVNNAIEANKKLEEEEIKLKED